MNTIPCRQCLREAEEFVFDGKPFAWCADCFGNRIDNDPDLMDLRISQEEFIAMCLIYEVMES